MQIGNLIVYYVLVLYNGKKRLGGVQRGVVGGGWWVVGLLGTKDVKLVLEGNDGEWGGWWMLCLIGMVERMVVY